jgi:hypothetical protein
VSIEVCGFVDNKRIIFHKLAEVMAFRVVSERVGAIGYMSVHPNCVLEIM